MRRVFWILCLVLCSVSCQRTGIADELDAIAGYVFEKPDSALSVLSAIPCSDLDKESRARYTLLYALSLNRLHLDTLRAEVLLPAEQYFRKHKKDKELMGALYCLGRIYSENEDWQNAVLCFKESESYANRLNDPYFNVLLLSSMRFLFLHNHDKTAYLEYARKTNEAVEAYHNNESWRIEDKMALADALAVNGLYQESDSLFRLAFAQLDTADVSARELLYGARCAMNKKGMMPDLAILFTERALAAGAKLNDEQSYQYCYAQLLTEKESSVQWMLDSLRNQSPTLESDFWNYKITRQKREYDLALEYCESFAGKRINELLEKNSNSVYKAIAEQERMTATLNDTKAKNRLHLIILTGILSLISIAALSFFFRYRRIRQEREIEKLVEMEKETRNLLSIARADCLSFQKNNQDLAAENSVLNERIQQLQQSICHSFQKQLEDIGSIITADLSQLDEESLKNKTIHTSASRIGKILDDIKGREKRLDDFEKEINARLDDVMAKIHLDFPDLNDRDYLFIGYMAAHFDTTAIAFLANMSKANVRTKMFRMRKLIFSRPSRHIELYRSVFQTKFFSI